MPAEILRGYTYDRRASRFRDTTRGQFVSRSRILELLDLQVNRAERRLGDIVTAMHEGQLSTVYGQVLMRDELRRLHLQNAALGRGGFDRLSFREYGRAGQMLREDYQRMTNLTNDIANGRVTLPQALNRVHGYVGSARVNFLEAERDAAREGAASRGVQLEERRRLGASEHCRDCVRWAGLGWQSLGTLPLPGQQSVCSRNCRCTLERREVQRVAA